MHLPSLNALRMFDAAARRLNFGRAAEDLNLTQGAVAQQVRRLEADLGQQLFIRKARGLALTAAGRTYAAEIRRAMAIIEDATHALDASGQTLTLSVPPSFATKLLAPNLSSFSELHPDIVVEIRASEAIASFRADAVDMAVRQGEPPFGDDVNFAFLCPLNLCAVCSADYAQTAGAFDMDETLTHHRLIYDGHAHWDALVDQAGAPRLAQTLRFNQTGLALDAAVNGQGVALAPAVLARADIEAGRLEELWRADEDGPHGYYIVTPKSADSVAIEAMSKWLKTLVS